MAKTLEQLMNEQKAFIANAGNRINGNTDKRASEIKGVVANVGVRVNAHTSKEAEDTRRRSDANHEATRAHSDQNHEETRREIRKGFASMADYVSIGQVILGAILGIIAGLAMWFLEKDVIVKPTAFDAVGNVTAYGTDVWMVAILAVVFGIFVFFVVNCIISGVRKLANR